MTVQEEYGVGKVLVGGDSYPQELDVDQLRDGVLYKRHYIKLSDSSIYRDGKKVDKAKLAIVYGRPGAKVTVVPGIVYRNGKPLKERTRRRIPTLRIRCRTRTRSG